jgi:hypothetical protein
MIQQPNRPPKFQPQNAVPIIGQQQTNAQAAIQQAVQGMASQIYVRLASEHIAGIDAHEELDFGELESLARVALDAAKSYFTGLRIATFEDKNG